MNKTLITRIIKIICLSLGLAGLLLATIGYMNTPAAYDTEAWYILKSISITSIVLLVISYFIRGKK